MKWKRVWQWFQHFPCRSHFAFWNNCPEDWWSHEYIACTFALREYFANIIALSLCVCATSKKKKNLTEQLGPLERAMILRNFSYTICVYRFRLVKMFESQHSYLCFLCIWSIEPQKQQREEKKLSLHLLCIIKETSKAKALVPLRKGESLREKRDRARKKREDE